MGRAGLRRPTGSLGNIGGDPGTARAQGDGRGACLPDSTRRLLALLALWRPLIHEPELERRLRAVGTLSRPARCPGLCAASWLPRFGRNPLGYPGSPVDRPLAGPTGRGARRCRSLAAVSSGCIWRCHCRMHWLRPPPLPVGIGAGTSVLAPAASSAETGALQGWSC